VVQVLLSLSALKVMDMVAMVTGSQGKIRRSEKVSEFDIPKSGKNQRVREVGKIKVTGCKS